jgi:predicted RNase H-like nuclease (RuvC/YqgF family)
MFRLPVITSSSVARCGLALISLTTLFASILWAAPTRAADEEDLTILVIQTLSATAAEAAEAIRDQLVDKAATNEQRDELTDLAALVKQIREATEQIKEITDAIKALRGQIEALDAQGEAAEEQRNALAAMIAAQLQEIEKLEEAIDKLEAKISDISGAEDKVDADPTLKSQLHANLLLVRSSAAKLKATGDLKLTAPQPTSTPTPRPLSTPRTLPGAPKPGSGTTTR